MINSSLFTNDKDDWRTPIELFQELHNEFEFTIDAAASPQNALLPRYWTKDDDALMTDWFGERVYCNPPYGRMAGKFIRKAALCEAHVSLLLIPARTDTHAWHDCIFGKAEVRFLRGRLKFSESKGSAPFPSAVVIWRRI